MCFCSTSYHIYINFCLYKLKLCSSLSLLLLLSQRFCFGGRLIFGPDVRSIFLTLFLIVTPVILFCAFVSKSLINEFQHHIGKLIVAICVIFTVYVSSLPLSYLIFLFCFVLVFWNSSKCDLRTMKIRAKYSAFRFTRL